MPRSNVVKINDDSNIVPFSVVSKKKDVKRTLSGEVKKNVCNKKAGVSSEVSPLKSEEEIKAVVTALNERISEAQLIVNESGGKKLLPLKQLRNAYRNKLIWLVGMNIGVRASDFLELRWNFFFDMDSDGNIHWKDFYSLQPMKQRKQHKFVKLFFNNTVKQAILDYLTMYPITQKTISGYMFTNDKDEHITVQQLWNIVNGTCKSAGITQNVGTHTLRKTWAYHCWHNAEDKNKALIILQKCFNHSSPQTTMGYIGILSDEIEDMYMSIELGASDM